MAALHSLLKMQLLFFREYRSFDEIPSAYLYNVTKGYADDNALWLAHFSEVGKRFCVIIFQLNQVSKISLKTDSDEVTSHYAITTLRFSTKLLVHFTLQSLW